jgi:hypothetical protein
MASSVCCRRCRLPLQGIEARNQAERVCLACALRIARIPLAPLPMECRWYRNRDGHLQRKWLRVEFHGTTEMAEFWLKVAVHFAGLAALLATPTVAALLAHVRDQFNLLS